MTYTFCVLGKRVQLMKGKECVGITQLEDDDVLHGHTVPAHYSKVHLEVIKPKTPPKVKGPFDDDYLTVGQYTAWPLNELEGM